MSDSMSNTQYRRHPILASALVTTLLGLALAACGSAGASGQAHKMTVGLTYIPNIQFAPFYVAAEKGYYKDAGLDVTLRHHSFAEDEFGALVAGSEDVIFGSGDEMLQARDKHIDVTYIANVFTSYPVALIVPAASAIHTIADLKGHTVGIPGPYGATYIGLLALLKSAGLGPRDVTIQSIQYTQVAALSTGKVDAVMGYINNEPIQFQQLNFAIRTFPVSSLGGLVSNGLAALQKTLNARPDDIKKLVTATLRGVQYTLAHPDEAITISQKYVPDLTGTQQIANARAVLQATLPLWMMNASQPGYIDPQAWQAMAMFMQTQGLLSSGVPISQTYSDQYLPSSLAATP